METLRQYALEKLGESGEANRIRDRHRDHYTAKAAVLDEPTVHQKRIEQIDTDIDNLRAAFAWSREHGDAEATMRLESSPSELGRSRQGDGTDCCGSKSAFSR